MHKSCCLLLFFEIKTINPLKKELWQANSIIIEEIWLIYFSHARMSHDKLITQHFHRKFDAIIAKKQKKKSNFSFLITPSFIVSFLWDWIERFFYDFTSRDHRLVEARLVCVVFNLHSTPISQFVILFVIAWNRNKHERRIDEVCLVVGACLLQAIFCWRV